MEPQGAIVFVPREGGEEPRLLKKLLFQPGAVWLAEALKAHGVERFFIVCHGDDRENVRACFPKGTELVSEGAEDASVRLSAFLAACEGDVVVVTRPVLVYFPQEGVDHMVIRHTSHGEPQQPDLCVVPAAGLASALAAGTDFAAALREFGTQEGLAGSVIPLAPNDPMNDLYAANVGVARLCSMGVRVLNPHNTYVDPTVTVGEGTVILPGTILRGHTVIGKDCEIGPNAMITDCTLGHGVVVNSSQLNESTVDDGAKIGPFAYVRPHCRVGKGVKVGDFVELKNSVIGDDTKISHLTYVGDSDVGAHVNFGCGTVTVNYDGATKFRTTIGDGAFIGCNTNLVAPVTVGEGAYTAAGSTITEDVPADSLAIARSQQVVKKQWAAKRKRRAVEQGR